MSVAKWVDTYGIHQWRIIWSRYRKLAGVGVEPTTTEFRSRILSNSASRPWFQFALTANFVQLLEFHRLFSVTFHLGYCLRQSPGLFKSKFCWANHMMVAERVDRYGIHQWRIIWRTYRKLASVGFESTNTQFHWDALTDRGTRPWVELALRANILQRLQFHRLFSVTFHFGYWLRQLPRLF